MLWLCVCPSVRLSVRPSVTNRSCTKTAKQRIMQTTSYGSAQTVDAKDLDEIPLQSPSAACQIEVG